MPNYLLRSVALLTVSVAFSSDAFAAERTGRSTGQKRVTNPFAVSIYSRLVSNPFGLPALSAAPGTVPATETASDPVTPAPLIAQEPVASLDAIELTPASIATRPPYRPPVRSPFRPPPRPPFAP
ncbi:hypothetical protein [Botrimarina mediterranea]|uniref:Uncharacterized protein n=1 Tax=Botrimarina mediterranea TaxID=2528022 RepID=A0A518K5G8_9BACT|nr:hypothetical protein [Botrimarina mediterranea]QDV73040.1 hypothetical protein Spa11_12280 [Botrimarina mediterranea]QDV77613.1 hypothetical protein K2D_12100 [Planctomycetes bacterium K2D]